MMFRLAAWKMTLLEWCGTRRETLYPTVEFSKKCCWETDHRCLPVTHLGHSGSSPPPCRNFTKYQFGHLHMKQEVKPWRCFQVQTVNQNLNFTVRWNYALCLRLWRFGVAVGGRECLTSKLYRPSSPSSLHILANGPLNSQPRSQSLCSAHKPVPSLH